ncbi:DUF6337 family protein [Enterobacter cloacae]|uniref:DUF6337 family protein n=3 Tax=Enterobacter cloacae TaxID=550 RepID=UPI000DF68931|nr:DUF6337 family protein [Enterobacter cloacae]MCK6709374.1 DUF6337 family protein [Enterobacter cloacae]RDB40435.1 hypothetical protein DPX44_05245 [Enterobacter cloacae]WIF61000.1 DUF6337 family protein [Enterobacter cloacae]
MFAFFFLVILFGFSIDYFVWRRITPLIASYIGVFFIVLTHILFGKQLGFVDIEDGIYTFISLFFLIGLIASLVCAFIMAWLTKNMDLRSYKNNKTSRVSKAVIWLALLISFLCAYFIYSAGTKLGSYVSEDFENALTYGVPGHVFAILVSLMPFVLKRYHADKRKSILFLLLCILVLLFMKQVKYWVMIPFVWMVWYSVVSGYIKLTFSRLIILSVLIIFLLTSFFFLVYFMKVVFSTTSQSVDYSAVIYDIMIHFFGYLYSGILTFSVYFRQGIFNNLSVNDLMGLFAGPINVLNLILGEDLINLNLTRPFVVLNNYSGTVGNVPSFWGTLLMASGYLSFGIYFILMFAISLLQWFSKYSNLALMVYTFLTSFLFFSWFDYYYYLLMPFEVSMLCIFFFILFEKRMKTNFIE